MEKVFDRKAVDWVQAARCGVNVQYLETNGYMDILLSGGTTPPIPLFLSLGGMFILMDGCLSLEEKEDGAV